MSTGRILATLCLACAVLCTGCSDACHDACANESACNGKLGWAGTSLDTCVTNCQNDTSCQNKAASLSCRATIPCENSTTYLGEELTCAGKCAPAK